MRIRFAPRGRVSGPACAGPIFCSIEAEWIPRFVIVEPLFAALESYDVWFTGLRRDQSPSRAQLQHEDFFRLPSGKHLRKVSPLAAWTNQDVWRYLKLHDIPVLPLYDQGYTSIGCEPCTSLPVSADDLRSGRWGGRKKLECGIHVSGDVYRPDTSRIA